MSARKDLDDANVSTVGADEPDAIFDAAKKKALEAVGGKVPKKRKSKTTSERRLPRGVRKSRSGKFESKTYCGGKDHHIGTFDTPEQASAAYVSVRKFLDDAKVSALGADEANATFVEAKKKALESLGGFIQAKRDFPRGVRKTTFGKFQSRTKWNGKIRYIGTFDTPEQASAAYMSARRDLDDAKARTCGSSKDISAMFDAAKNNALEVIRVATR